MKKYCTLPNFFTALRMAGTVWLLFLRPLSGAFFAVYTLSGVSDVVDGWLARRTHSTSELGARLDSAADLMYYGVMVVKLLPELWASLPKWLWWCAAFVLTLRAAAYAVAAGKYRRFASLLTYLNKLTGFFVFFLPYFMGHFLTPYCALLAVVGAASSGEELAIHLREPVYDPSRKSLFMRK